jgi:hypothetical protein
MPNATPREGGHLCGPGDDYPGPARRKLDNMTGRESSPQGATSIGGASDTGLWYAPGFMA